MDGIISDYRNENDAGSVAPGRIHREAPGTMRFSLSFVPLPGGAVLSDKYGKCAGGDMKNSISSCLPEILQY